MNTPQCYVTLTLSVWFCSSSCTLQMKAAGKGKAVPLQAWTGPEGSKEVKV